MPEKNSRGRVLVIHGLDVSKELMQLLCSAVAEGGFDVFALDLPGHGDSTARFEANRARNVVAQAIDTLGPIDVAVGHSLGGGLLLDVAAERTIPKMILLSPAPTPLGEIDFRNTLVVSGGFDIPAIDAFIPKLDGAEWWRATWGAHGTALFNPKQARDMVRWVGGNSDDVRAGERLFWNLALLVSAISLGVSLLPRRTWFGADQALSIELASAWFVLAGVAAAIILRFVPVADWLHLYATSYLIGFLFVIGCLFCVTARLKVPYSLPAVTLTSVVAAVAAAGYVIGVVLFVGAGHIAHNTLTDGRWWRFPAIALLSFPLFYFDETTLRRKPGWKTAITGILTRAILGASVVTGALVLSPPSAFLALITHFVVFFWIALWFMTHLVHRSVQEPLAAAIFASLVQGWVFAAVVVIT